MPRPARPPVASLTAPEITVGGVVTLCLVATAWGFAGRATWAPAAFTSLSFVAALIAVILARGRGEPLHLRAFLPLGAFSLLVGVSLLNTSHLPVPGQPGAWLPREGWISWLPTTVDRATTAEKALPWLSALLLGGALRQARFSPTARNLFWSIWIAHGLVLAFVGIYFHLTSPYEILGAFRDRHGYHFGPFVYRNHWTAYAAILVMTALGFAFSAFHLWRNRRGRWDGMLAGLGAALLLGITPIIPGSRSGTLILSTVLVAAFARLAFLMLRSPSPGGGSARGPRRALALTGFATIILLALAPMLKAPLQNHWQRTLYQAQAYADGTDELRFLLTRDSLRMAAQRPIWGWGVGSYAHVFPLFQGDYLRDENGRASARIIHAHNDWAHLLAEAGVFGFSILVLPLVILVRRAGADKGVRVRWALGGLALTLIYALVDFPLHNPAVLLLFTSILCTASPPSRALPLSAS